MAKRIPIKTGPRNKEREACAEAVSRTKKDPRVILKKERWYLKLLEDQISAYEKYQASFERILKQQLEIISYVERLANQATVEADALRDRIAPR